MTTSKNNVCKISITVMLLCMTCRGSNAKNDIIVKRLSNQVELLLSKQNSMVNDIEQLKEKLDTEISTRRKLTETCSRTESLVTRQQREIGLIKAQLQKEYDINKYLLHNNKLLLIEVDKISTVLTEEITRRDIAAKEFADDAKPVDVLNRNISCVNCCRCHLGDTAKSTEAYTSTQAPKDHEMAFQTGDAYTSTQSPKNHELAFQIGEEYIRTQSPKNDEILYQTGDAYPSTQSPKNHEILYQTGEAYTSTQSPKNHEMVLQTGGVTHLKDALNSKDERQARDCDSIYKLKYRKDGVYRIRLSADETVNLYCVLEDSIHRGMLAIQRRKNGTLNFDRSWTDYQKGFGDFGGDFWLGNEILFRLINLSQSRVYIVIVYYVKSHNYQYGFFMQGISLRNATRGYQLIHFRPLSGRDNGNMGPISRSYFATKDNTSFRDARCPRVNGGWWYTTFPQCNVRYSNPNSRYTTLTTEDGEQYMGFNAPKGGINITDSEILMYFARYSD